MSWFLGGILFLIVGYFTYGKLVEKIFKRYLVDEYQMECSAPIERNTLYIIYRHKKETHLTPLRRGRAEGGSA